MNDFYDVIVAGGGLAGTSAAISAARLGVSVLLIEKYGFLGGMSTAGLVNPFMASKTSKGVPLVGGLYTEICDAMNKQNGMLDRAFDPEAMKFVLQELLIESGSELLLHSYAKTPIVRNNKITGLIVDCNSESLSISANTVIDATGDADVSVKAGVPYDYGNSVTGLSQAMTLMFVVGGVDVKKSLMYAKDHNDEMRFPKPIDENDVDRMLSGAIGIAGFYKHVESAKNSGELCLNQDMIFFITLPTPGYVVVNTTHVAGYDPTKSTDMTKAEIEGRQQANMLMRFLKKYIPGFENAYLSQTAAQIGIRESRRIKGEYTFTVDDVVNGRKFFDSVLRSVYPVDIHSSAGKGYAKDEDHIPPVGPPEGDWYELSYRCMIPINIDNLIAAGRCISSTHEGHSAVRIMPNCIAMGQAAGVAGAMSSIYNTPPRNIDINEMHRILKEQGAII